MRLFPRVIVAGAELRSPRNVVGESALCLSGWVVGAVAGRELGSANINWEPINNEQSHVHCMAG